MNIDNALKRCAVLGAAGKMGRGITLLLLQDMARAEAINFGSTGTGRYQLILVDSRLETLAPLRRYLREQLVRYAEKHINGLRNAYAADATLIGNSDIITAFVEGALDNVSCSTELAAAAPAYLVFEALPEDIPLKCAALKALHTHASQPQHYFSNTSSIPIWLLDQQAGLAGTIVGFHFYNPPPAQKLVEMVTLRNGDPLATLYAMALGARLDKTLVRSRDFPGFTGNGYFMREIAFAYRMALELKPIFGWPGAIYAVDWITREFLIRPMGIFQLIDYVGIDICAQIAATMGSLLHDIEIIVPQITAMAARGVKGGQDAQGMQLPGFFRYQRGVPEAIYDEQSGHYLPLTEDSLQKAQTLLGPLPAGHRPWKQLSTASDRQERLAAYFQQLVTQKTVGAELATTYLNTCRLIAMALVLSEAAASEDDLATILTEGFHHLYSPLDSWVTALLMPDKSTPHSSTSQES